MQGPTWARSSLAYLDQDGIIKGSEYERLSWRNNLNVNWVQSIIENEHRSYLREKRVIDETTHIPELFSAMTADPVRFTKYLVEVPLFKSYL